MKILRDECLPLDFRHSFSTHEVFTVQWAGLKGKNNGELLSASESAGYDLLLTVDQGIPHQQHRAGRKISIIVIRSRTSQIEDLWPLAARTLKGAGNDFTGPDRRGFLGDHNCYHPTPPQLSR